MAAGALGPYIQEVIHYFTLRGKFSSVHPELRREGIIKVEVGEKGLRFIRDTGAASKSLILRGDVQTLIENKKGLFQGEPTDGPRRTPCSSVTCEDSANDDEDLLRQAIALSLEENQMEQEDEEELLKQAIALSLADWE